MAELAYKQIEITQSKRLVVGKSGGSNPSHFTWEKRLVAYDIFDSYFSVRLPHMRRGVVGVNHPPPCLTLNQSHDVTLTLLQDHFLKKLLKLIIYTIQYKKLIFYLFSY